MWLDFTRTTKSWTRMDFSFFEHILDADGKENNYGWMLKLIIAIYSEVNASTQLQRVFWTSSSKTAHFLQRVSSVA